MTLQEYEEFTKRTARGLYNKDFSDKNLFLIFLALGMVGEAGEVANKVKKYMRGGRL